MLFIDLFARNEVIFVQKCSRKKVMAIIVERGGWVRVRIISFLLEN